MVRRQALRPAALAVTAWLACSAAHAATDTVLVLYTNDIHDHVRPGPNGRGGMPYVSGYAKQVRATRPDVLLLDAGDVVSKGDWVAYATKGEITYEALGRAGYAAVAPGNHDFDYGLPQLLRYASISGLPLLCANAAQSDGSPLSLPKSRIVDVDDVKVG